MAVKIAVDLGSSNIRIYKYGSGIVLCEPSVLAVDAVSSEIKAIGTEAKRLIGKTADNTRIVFPIYEGEIVSDEHASALLTYCLKKTNSQRAGYALFSLPCGCDAVMVDKFRRVAAKCGIKRTDFIIEPVLSALGQNVALNDFSPCFAIDIGGGVTNLSAFSLDGIIAGLSMNLGGNNIDAHIIDYIAEVHSLKIGLLTAERLKVNAGSLLNGDLTGMPVNGRDIKTGKPRSVTVTAETLFEPISIYIEKIADSAGDLLSKLPAEVLAEIRHAGLYLSGGTSRLAGLQSYFSQKMGMPVHICDSPELAAAAGGGVALSNTQLTDKVKLKFTRQ